MRAGDDAWLKANHEFSLANRRQGYNQSPASKYQLQNIPTFLDEILSKSQIVLNRTEHQQN